MAVQIGQRVTVAEFDAFVMQQENVGHNFEYIGGEIVEVVSNPKSSELGMTMGFFIKLHIREAGIKGAVTGADGGYIVMGERYIPDAAFISAEKQSQLPYMDGYNPHPPDLAVEVLSPSNDEREMRIKVGNYLTAGTVVWVLDPEYQLIEVYILGEPVKVLTIDDALEGGDVLPGFRVTLKEIFS